MKQTFTKLIHTIVFLALLASFVPVPDVNAAGLCYVNSNAVSGTNNGTSWLNAYTSLQSAIADTCTEIWVAAGTYKTTTGADRTISFSLKNGMKIYGGFAGSETLLSQRNPLNNVTILSGEIGLAGIADNSYHVISNTNIDSTALLDGFTVTGGNATGSSTYGRGGGIYNYKSSPILKNLIIVSNHAKYGGGISNFIDSSPNISNLMFMDNSAEIFGGAMENYNQSSPNIFNTTFIANSSDNYGGAIHNGGYSYPLITNVTLTKNTAFALGGAIYNNLDSNPTIRNTILWGNLAHPSAPEIYNDNGSAGTSTIRNSIVQGGCPQYSTCTSIILSDPILGDVDNYGGFTPTINIDFGSSAIDAGDEDFCPSTDQRNIARTIGSGCDIGAYEYNTIIVTTINNSGDGSLRYILANSSEGSIVKFDSSLSGQTIHLESPIIIEKGVIIDGSNLSTPIQISGDTNNDGTGEVAVFQTGGSAPIELRNLIITKGKSTGTTGGGGIENYGNLTIKNSTVSNNEYVNGLGGGGIYNKGTLTVIDSVISGNTAIEGAGIFNDLNSELTISGTTFSNNSSITEPESPGGSAGAIGNIGTLTIENSTFTNNLAYSGGGAIVNAINGNTNISNSVFTGNTTYGNGGAIINMDATMIVETSTFNSNTSKGGGAIYNDGQLTITGGTFTENDASFGNGGGIANLETLTLADASISNNSASLGGGIYNSGLEITITNTTINTNTADLGGGGIANQWTGDGSMTIAESFISGNSAPNGGGIHNLSSTGLVSIADSTISDNMSTGNGGGIASFGVLSLSNTLLLYNYAFDRGGAVFIVGTTTISNSTLINNSSREGGGIYNGNTGVLTLTNSTMSENSARDGGAIENRGELIINGTLFSHNQAEDKGGAIHTSSLGSGIIITNSTITQNISVRGGAIGVEGAADNTIRNTTFVHNQAVTGSEIWMITTVAQVQILNSILLCENTNYCLYYRPDGLSLSPNTLIKSGILASVGLSPLANNGGSTQTMALLPGSPAINAGDNSTCTETDQRGVERPQGIQCDLGAYEYVDGTQPIVSSIVKASTSPTNATAVNFTVTFSEPVFNVDFSDFSLTTTNNITGASAISVTGSGTTFTVTVNTGTGDGTLRLNVKDSTNITDSIGNQLNGGFFDGENYSIDKTAPAITINNPNTSSAQNKTITASTSDGSLSMSNTTGSACDGTLTFIIYSNQTFTSESDNGKKVCYKAADSLGNTAYSLSNTITGIDTTAPNTQIDTSPSSPTVDTTANFTFSSPDSTATFECSLDNAAFTVCTSPFQISGLSGGSHNLRVRAKDAAGNLDTTPASSSWIINSASQPTVFSITLASASPSSATSVDFTVIFTEDVTDVDTDGSDFELFTTGVSGASITGVTPISASAYTVNVNTGSGNGTIRLDVPDTAIIKDLADNNLSGLPFTSGEFYTISKSSSPPTSATFADVPMNHPYWLNIEILYANGFSSGCSTSPLLFCPEDTMNRAQSAVFMLRGNFGPSYIPPNPPYASAFSDNWSPGPWAQKWAQGMLEEGLTAGCSTSSLLFCPWEQMPRLQAAVFGMRLKEGNAYIPPAATGTVFADITDPNIWYAKWAEQAYLSGILPACGTQGGKPLFCPNNLVSRGLGAYMIVRAKNLTMP